MKDIITDLRQIGQEIDRLKEANTDAHRRLGFVLNLLTDEQMCEYAHHWGGLCTWDECPCEEDDA